MLSPRIKGVDNVGNSGVSQEQVRWHTSTKTMDLPPPHLVSQLFIFPPLHWGGHWAISHYFSDKFIIVRVGWDQSPEHGKLTRMANWYGHYRLSHAYNFDLAIDLSSWP